MNVAGEYLTVQAIVFACVALSLSLFFEFINGFHDTANAVATVIYTRSLPATAAVVWSGIWNFIGVLLSTGAVAYSVVAILPPSLVLNVASGRGAAALIGLLLAAVIWNFGTWYIGLPCSSSHALIGSILGVSLADSWIHSGSPGGLRWDQIQDVFLALSLSPIIGFGIAGILLYLLRLFIKEHNLFKPADQARTPPGWIRAILIVTCTGVSFAHGTNDGQKGMGLLMLVLIVVLPSALALNPELKPGDVHRLVTQLDQGIEFIQPKNPGKPPLPSDQATRVLVEFAAATGKMNDEVFPALGVKMTEFRSALANKASIQDLPYPERQTQRKNAYLINETISKLRKEQQIGKEDLKELSALLKSAIQYIPVWIKAVVAFSLGLGTMVGWKRIVTTVAERIGKNRLAYAQGASAEVTTMATILFADRLGLPVSTTHVLTSGIAGTMVANRAGVQRKTVVSIILAWVLTLPVCVFLGALFFAGSLFVFFNLLGWK
ncbi:MAG: inorganic phosphate transporter [Verrucomicrobia bacterium]|nr:inorganic phosphate transporter [Verrucomicrobiota bacterium]